MGTAVALLASYASPEIASTKSFPKFPLLPTELRCKIWHYANPICPRRIIWDYGDDWPAEDLVATYPIINVNKEAREEILKGYTKYPHPEGEVTYVNFDIDTLCLRQGLKHLQELLEARNPILNGLKWLEIAPVAHEPTQHELEKLRDVLSLELITITAVEDIWISCNGLGYEFWMQQSVKGARFGNGCYVTSLQCSYIANVINTLAATLGFTGNSDVSRRHGLDIAVILPPVERSVLRGIIIPEYSERNPLITLAQPQEKVWPILEKCIGSKDRNVALEEGWYIKQMFPGPRFEVNSQ